MILLIDNYDSFSYNVYQLTASIDPDVQVIRNDEKTVEEIEAMAPSHIILSPGPGRPEDAGICEEVIRRLTGRIPILGICLGHQAICEVFGATVTYAKQLMHGKQSVVKRDMDSVLFAGMSREFVVARYHSLAAAPESIPDVLRVTAVTEQGEVMAVEHRQFPVYGVQFHPESILTPKGRSVMENFLRYAGKPGKSKDITESLEIQDSDVQGLKEMQDGKTGTETMRETAGSAAMRTEDNSTKAVVAGKEKLIDEAIVKLSKKEDIGYDMAKKVMNEIMDGEASEVQKSAYLTALSMKGETIEEITGSAEAMRSHALPVSHNLEVMEIVGTGGDGSDSFNISTTAAFLISAAGVPVAKHGNRAASSKSGAADCLEALGVNISQEPEKAERLLRNPGICFFFAQKYHAAMKHAGPVRRELGIRTVFNILGPLTNPANPSMQIMGVYDEGLLDSMARVLSNLGVKKGMVVYGEEKLDEISICGPTKVCMFKGDKFRHHTITPEEAGLKRYAKEELKGGTPQENAAITRAILSGEERGAKRDAAVINAGAALFVAGKAPGLKEAVKLAQETIDSGRALEQLEKFIRLSNED